MYDVAWCPSGGHVAASLSNGGVAIWDLQHLPSSTAGQGLQGADVRGEDTGKIIGTHERSVNRLSWNPFHHNMLLSGSQVCKFCFLGGGRGRGWGCKTETEQEGERTKRRNGEGREGERGRGSEGARERGRGQLLTSTM